MKVCFVTFLLLSAPPTSCHGTGNYARPTKISPQSVVQCAICRRPFLEQRVLSYHALLHSRREVGAEAQIIKTTLPEVLKDDAAKVGEYAFILLKPPVLTLLE